MTRPQFKATILVVDDDAAVTKTFERVLSDRGYRVLVARNAEQALRELDQTRPDAVIVDLRMPLVNGLGLLYRIRSREPHQKHLPVLVMTGDAALSDETLAELSTLGATVRYKPLRPTELLEAVRTLIEGGDARDS
jgi:DNA-binding response OmpR family regulator